METEMNQRFFGFQKNNRVKTMTRLKNIFLRAGIEPRSTGLEARYRLAKLFLLNYLLEKCNNYSDTKMGLCVGVAQT